MRKSKVCPKCDSKKLLLVSQVADSSHSDRPRPAALAMRHEGHSFVGNEKIVAVGQMTAVLCSQCGYTEYYCQNPEAVQPDGKFIAWLT